MKKLYLIILFLFGLLSQEHLFSQCDISLSNSSPCALASVVFTVDNPAGTYSWDFDNDGIIDTMGVSVNNVFPESTVDITYTVTLYQNGVA